MTTIEKITKVIEIKIHKKEKYKVIDTLQVSQKCKRYYKRALNDQISTL